MKSHKITSIRLDVSDWFVIRSKARELGITQSALIREAAMRISGRDIENQEKLRELVNR